MTALGNKTPRTRASLKLIRQFRSLKDRGYSAVQAVATSNRCCISYRFRIFYLAEHGSARLIENVEQRRIPLTVAIHIARAKNPDLQNILANGYLAGTVAGRQIDAIRKIIDQYESENRTPLIQSGAQMCGRTTAADSLIRHFRNETDKQKLIITRAKQARSRLAFIVSALKRLLSEQSFVTLLGAEGIRTMPAWLAERIKDRMCDA